ncbi:hypothetical protein E2C01_022794 [Portunus trituberculatus]|uniref:Uncharacterized protein n=1 Tax=Portunus trituberculatus TaxID=210409 RepID=A0A5B7E9A0_PORTR|nr:hypothetical protein [Portunus trituberculatus]
MAEGLKFEDTDTLSFPFLLCPALPCRRRAAVVPVMASSGPVATKNGSDNMARRHATLPRENSEQDEQQQEQEEEEEEEEEEEGEGEVVVVVVVVMVVEE